jgi:L-ascorbate metabolism protein UlaG (beta-lactamase superfamily)
MTHDVSDTLQLRFLAWSGLEVRLGDTRLLIDPLEHVARFESQGLGRALRPVPSIDTPAGTHALITHLHGDHFDQELLARLAPEGTVGCHAPSAPAVAAAGLEAVGQEFGRSRTIGSLTVTPVPSMDWRADDQVAWIVEGGGVKVIHCGDTMWHGSWWQIARDHGPFAVAFVPINGVIVRSDSLTAVIVPVTMTPEQAVEAAYVLGATTACAIHHGTFHNPPRYVEQPDAEQRFRRAAQERGITAVLPHAGDPVPLAV